MQNKHNKKGTNMDISKLKLVWKYITGGMGKVVDYLLDILNQALAKLDPSKKEQIQAVLNLAKRVLAILKNLRFLCPTKWQTAYDETVEAVEAVVDAMEDLKLTPEELEKIVKEFKEAVEAWKSDDDETCVDCSDCFDCAPEAA